MEKLSGLHCERRCFLLTNGATCRLSSEQRTATLPETTPIHSSTCQQVVSASEMAASQRGEHAASIIFVEYKLTSLFTKLVTMVVLPSGYKIVITRALGMQGIYCTQPSSRCMPSCFSTINAIHLSHPCYNCDIDFHFNNEQPEFYTCT